MKGLIVGAFVATEWLEATPENFPGWEPVEGRYGFIGEPAPVELEKQFLNKRVPDEYRRPGAANPVKYNYR